MYAPTGQRSSGPKQQVAPQQAAQVQGMGIAQAIQAADQMMFNKKREARRIYERAQDMMREDLNTVAGFNIAAAGPDAAPALREAANELKAKIREVNDPVEAQALISDFSQKYNFFKNRETQLAEERKFADTLSVADRATRDKLNAGLEVGMEYEDIDASTVAQMDQAFRKQIVYQDGRLMVQVGDEMVPYDQAESLMDFSVYIPNQRATDIGDLQTTAMNEAVQGRIIARGGGVFSEDAARMEYNTLTEDSNRNGQALRLQILEDYVDTTIEGRDIAPGETGESRSLIQGTFFEEGTDQLKAWQLGPNAKDRFQGSEEDWDRVWGDDGSGWNLIDQERGKFVEYARTKKDIDQKLKEERLKTSRKQQQEESNYAFGQLVETPDTGVGPQGQSEMSYSMTALKEPLKVEASTFSPGGDYEIHGFGVNADGEITARIFDDLSITLYQYVDGNGVTKTAGSEAEAQRAATESGGVFEGKTVKVDNPTPPQRTIVISPGDQDLGNEVYNRIFGVDPITGKATNMEAVRLLEAHRAQAASKAWSSATNQ